MGQPRQSSLRASVKLAAGSRVGPYEVIDPIGAGGMGEVYRVRDPRLGREVALKILPSSLAADPARMRRFEIEAQAAGALNHPNVLVVHDVGVHDGAPYVVSELLEGETLRERLALGPLPPRKAVDTALQIARGLAAAHERGIVHRDLKPENLFLTRDGRAKILDFGLAKLADAETGPAPPGLSEAATEPGVVLGTVGYMSPEQVRGEPADARSDLFSFGAIFYEMLTGERAFRGSFPVETMNAILREEPPEITAANRALPPALDHIIQHCLEKDPARRFRSAHDLAFDLETLPTSSWPALMAPLARTARTRRRAWLAIALAAIPAAAFFVGRRTASRVEPGEPPSFRLLTFRRGTVSSARFTPDGQSVLYAAAWEGQPVEPFLTRPESPESRPLGFPGAGLLSVSPRGELALSIRPRDIGGWLSSGTLARVPMVGGAPRQILDEVLQCDWAPDGSTLAVVRQAEGRSRIEFPIGRVLYDTAGWVSHPRISRSGDRVAFIDHPAWGDDRGVVAVVDGNGLRRELTQHWVSAQGLAWGPRDEVWFTAAGGGVGRSLYAVTLDGRERMIDRVPGTLTLHDVSRDGKVLLSHDTLRSEVIGAAPGEAKERSLSWLDWTVSTDLSSDGRRLLLTEQGLGSGPHYSVYVRDTDGSAAVRLGEGNGVALSPDGSWVLATVLKAPTQLVLIPTGAGEGRPLPGGGLNHQIGADWTPDGRRIVFNGNEPGRGGRRVYVQDASGGEPRAISPDGLAVPTSGTTVAPDGSAVAALGADGNGWLLSLTTPGPPRAIAGFEPGDVPVQWTLDGRSVYVFRRDRLPLRVDRLDVTTGRRARWREITPLDPAGIVNVRRMVMTPDGSAYFYNFVRILSELYVVEGLR